MGDRMIRVVLVLHVYIQGYMYMGVLILSAFVVCYIWGIVGLQ
jgi:hypothetical protein